MNNNRPNDYIETKSTGDELKPLSSHAVLGEVRAIAERAINNSNGFHENWMELYEALGLIKDKVSEHFR